MKTIKQIADEIGVSKQAVFYRIKKPPLSNILQSLTTKVDGVLMVDFDSENLIKQAFSANTVKSFDAKEPSNTVKEPSKENTVFDDKQLGVKGVLNTAKESLNTVKEPSNTIKEPSKENTDFNEASFLRQRVETLIQELNQLISENNYLWQRVQVLEADLRGEREFSREQMNKLSELATQLAELARNNQTILAVEQSRTNPALLMGDEVAVAADQPVPSRGLFQRLFGKK